MNWSSLRAKMVHFHKAQPQVAHHCEMGLRQIEDGIATLARYGHHFTLSEGYDPPTTWPRTVYHFRLGERNVIDEVELRNLGPGWYNSPAAAEMAEGLDVQFAGRGGIRRHQLPAVNANASPVDWSADWRRQAIEEFLQRRRMEKEDGTI